MSEHSSPKRRRPRPAWLGRGLRIVEYAELTVGALLLSAIVVLVMMQVVARISPLGGAVWTGELARYSLMWLAFGLAGYLLGRDEHIALDVIDRFLPDLGQRIVRAFSMLVVAATCLAFAYEGWDLISSDSPIKSPAIGIPLAWTYLIPTAGIALTAVRAVLEVLFPAEQGAVVHVAGEALSGDSSWSPEERYPS